MQGQPPPITASANIAPFSGAPCARESACARARDVCRAAADDDLADLVMPTARLRLAKPAWMDEVRPPPLCVVSPLTMARQHADVAAIIVTETAGTGGDLLRQLLVRLAPASAGECHVATRARAQLAARAREPRPQWHNALDAHRCSANNKRCPPIRQVEPLARAATSPHRVRRS